MNGKIDVATVYRKISTNSGSSAYYIKTHYNKATAVFYYMYAVIYVDKSQKERKGGGTEAREKKGEGRREGGKEGRREGGRERTNAYQMVLRQRILFARELIGFQK